MFCQICSDWLKRENWQDDGRYFCDTCLESREASEELEVICEGIRIKGDYTFVDYC